jgi:hypothetical protein
MIADTNFESFRGDFKRLSFALYALEGDTKRAMTPSELTGVAVRFTAKRAIADADAAAIVRLSTTDPSPPITVAPTESKVVVEIPATATSAIGDNGETLIWDLQITDQASRPFTVAFGKWRVRGDVTRAG